MKLGVHLRATAEGAKVGEVARAAEELGFESLFLPEHTHIPSSYLAENPERADWAEVAAQLLDPFLALGAAAQATERLLVGTGVCLVPQHDPIVLAKQVATLDVLSGGRVLFGVGAGWLEGELRQHGVEPRRRFRLLRESLLAMKAIWASAEASFAGELVRFEGVRQGPKPIQQPHPPILVGGGGSRARAIARELGDGWCPLVETAREPEIGLPVTMYGVEPSREALAGYEAAGVERCVFLLEPGTTKATHAQLEQLAALDQSGLT